MHIPYAVLPRPSHKRSKKDESQQTADNRQGIDDYSLIKRVKLCHRRPPCQRRLKMERLQSLADKIMIVKDELEMRKNRTKSIKGIRVDGPGKPACSKNFQANNWVSWVKKRSICHLALPHNSLRTHPSTPQSYLRQSENPQNHTSFPLPRPQYVTTSNQYIS